MDNQAIAKTQTEYVKLNKGDLLTKIKENRNTHQREYEQAHAKWHDQQIEKCSQWLKKCEEHLDLVKAGKEKASIFSFPDMVSHALEEPQTHVKSYDKIIMMLEMAMDDIYFLSHKDFSRYGLDDWEWKDRFSETISNYK